MNRAILAALAGALALGGSPALAQVVRGALDSAYGTSVAAKDSAGQEEAAGGAAATFDGNEPSAFLSPPPVRIPEQGTRRGGNLIVGDPRRATFDEPKNPLLKNDKAKHQDSGRKFWWAGGGAVVGAGAGFLLGGPVGALIGGLLGAALGFFFGP